MILYITYLRQLRTKKFWCFYQGFFCYIFFIQTCFVCRFSFLGIIILKKCSKMENSNSLKNIATCPPYSIHFNLNYPVNCCNMLSDSVCCRFKSKQKFFRWKTSSVSTVKNSVIMWAILKKACILLCLLDDSVCVVVQNSFLMKKKLSYILEILVSIVLNFFNTTVSAVTFYSRVVSNFKTK